MNKILLFISLLVTHNVSAQDACAYDFDHNGIVDTLDVNHFRSLFGQLCTDCDEDTDGNGVIGSADLDPILGSFGQACNQQCIGVTNVLVDNLNTPGGVRPVTNTTNVIPLLHFTLEPVTDDLPLTGLLFTIETTVSQNGVDAFTLTIGDETFSVADNGSPYVWFDIASLVILQEGSQTECTFSFVKNAWFDAYQGTGEFMTPSLFEVDGISCDTPLAFMTPLTGETQYYYFQGITVSLAESSVTASGSTTMYIMTMDIDAFGGAGAFIDSGNGITTWSSYGNDTPQLTSSIGPVFGLYYIEDANDSATFTVTITIQNPPPNTTVGISGIWYALEFLGTEFPYPTTLTDPFIVSN